MTSQNVSGKALAVIVVVTFFVVALVLCSQQRGGPRGKQAAPAPSMAPKGVTVHPQGELAPMPLDAVSPPYLVDRGDGRGPQVERGVLRFGDAETTGGATKP